MCGGPDPCELKTPSFKLRITVEYFSLICALLEHGSNKPDRDTGALEDRFAVQDGLVSAHERLCIFQRARALRDLPPRFRNIDDHQLV